MLSVFQSVFLFCFTLARTNHLLWTDPEVEPEGGPEVEPDEGPDDVEDPKGEGPKGEDASFLEDQSKLEQGSGASTRPGRAAL